MGTRLAMLNIALVVAATIIVVAPMVSVAIPIVPLAAVAAMPFDRIPSAVSATIAMGLRDGCGGGKDRQDSRSGS
ncbi:MAG: hypothetical protein WBL20_12120 [Sphingobium sp.]|jgi:hypothetical protein|nr:MAG: hypothetical protein DI537_28250 [Stutzerimonas stutzeri]